MNLRRPLKAWERRCRSWRAHTWGHADPCLPSDLFICGSFQGPGFIAQVLVAVG